MGDTAPNERVSAVDGRVVANTPVCREHVAIELVLRDFPPSAPGQFLELQCRDRVKSGDRVVEWPPDGFPSLMGEEWHSAHAFLRRPFSIADHWTDADGGAHLVVISRAIGTGTNWLEALQPGAALNITGPLGRGFALPSPETPIVLVGGGVGIPPLLYLARRFHERGQRDVTLILGATTRDLLPVALREPPARDGEPRACVVLPGSAAFGTIITTDDGSLGRPGYATDGLAAWQQGRDAVRGTLVCACGPEPMLQAVARMTRQMDLDCQLCIERNMGCGLGTCLSCVVRRQDAAKPEGWSWALTCQDGPVFDRDELLDYAASQRP